MNKMTKSEREMREQFHRTMTVSFAVVFTTVYSMSFIISYLPEMTLWLGYSEQNKGLYGEIIIAAYFVGAFFASYPLSRLSDKLGHRPVLLALLIANAGYCLIFAFSGNLTLVLIMHFLMGTCNSLMSVARAISAIHTNNSTQTKGMACLIIGWAIGLNAGSATGGCIASPAAKYPETFGHLKFFHRFPYFLPPFIATIFSVITAIIVWRIYPDANKKITENTPECRPTEDTPINCFDTNDPHYSSIKATHKRNAVHLHDLYTEHESPTSSRNSNKRNDSKRTSDTPHDHQSFTQNNEPETVPGKTGTFVSLITDRNFVKTVIISVLTYDAGVTYIETFAVWASTVKDLGGLQYSTNFIGLVLIIVIVPSAIIQLVLAPIVERKIGSIHALIIYFMVRMVATTLMPLCRLIHNNSIQWTLIIVAQGLISICDLGSGLVVGILLNNSVPSTRVATVNGLCRSIVMLSKCIYSLIIGSLYTVSVTSDIGRPMDVSLVFSLMGASLWIGAIVAYFIPRRFENKYTELN